MIQTEGFRTLKDGEEVTYEMKQGPKGFHAVKVARTNPPASEAAPTPEAPASSNSEPKTES